MCLLVQKGGCQDVSGGEPVPVLGASYELYGMEINIQNARQQIKDAALGDDLLDDLGMGGMSEQLKELNLAELLENPPPGIDEAVAVSQVCQGKELLNLQSSFQVVQFLKSDKYSRFKRIVFDTAPTGHTLRLLTLPDFLEMTIGKIVQLRSKLDKAIDLVRGVLGKKKDVSTESAIQKLERIKVGLHFTQSRLEGCGLAEKHGRSSAVVSRCQQDRICDRDDSNDDGSFRE